MNSKILKLLVVGTKFGGTYMEAANNNDHFELIGCVAHTEKSCLAAGKKYHIAKDHQFLDLSTALTALPDIDVVAICVPNNLHYEFAKIVLNANKHLILEKPITETWEQAIELVKILDSHPGQKAMVGQTLRGVKALRLMEHFLEDGLIGTIEQMTFDAHWLWTGDPAEKWRFGLENMYLDDIGIHQFDQIRMLLNNRKCLKVFATTYNPPSYPLKHMKTTASAILTFEDHIHVNYFGSQSTKGEPVGWFGKVGVFGSKGSMTRSPAGNPFVQLEGKKKPRDLNDKYGKKIAKQLAFSSFEKIPFLLEDFYQAIVDDRAPITDLHDNLNTFAILLGIKKSAELHQEIDLQTEFPLP